jgi:hypothetical protein
MQLQSLVSSIKPSPFPFNKRLTSMMSLQAFFPQLYLGAPDPSQPPPPQPSARSGKARFVLYNDKDAAAPVQDRLWAIVERAAAYLDLPPGYVLSRVMDLDRLVGYHIGWREPKQPRQQWWDKETEKALRKATKAHPVKARRAGHAAASRAREVVKHEVEATAEGPT